ncbi:hypothetical protein ACFLTV_02330, partial [Chloroflexota bacterium]
MVKETQDSQERVIKEYPNTTRWLEGRLILGVGNLILTTERIAFLNQVLVKEKHVQKMQELSEAPSSLVLDYALTLHKNNFQIPLSSVTSAKVGLFAYFPIPRFCLRIAYFSNKKKEKIKRASFMFTISILRGFYQLEITTVMSWASTIKRVMKYK